MMLIRLFALLLMPLFCAPAVAGLLSSSESRFQEARVRVLAQRDDSGRVTGGIEILLEEGFKTYWKNPGDSGVPPIFDFSGSSGVQDIGVRMPLPEAFDDGAGGLAFGYKHGVIFPFEGKAEASGVLVLKLDFAVCGKLCIPMNAMLSLDLGKAAEADAEAGGRLGQTIARLPKPSPQGEASVRRTGAGEFSVRLSTPTPPGDLKVFPFAPGFFEIKGIEAAGNGMVLIRLAGQVVAGGKTYGPLTLTYGTAQESFERVFDVDAAQ